MYKRKRAGNTITRKINSTKDTAAKADKNHYISNSYLEGFIPIDTEYFTASLVVKATPLVFTSVTYGKNCTRQHPMLPLPSDLSGKLDIALRYKQRNKSQQSDPQAAVLLFLL